MFTFYQTIVAPLIVALFIAVFVSLHFHLKLPSQTINYSGWGCKTLQNKTTCDFDPSKEIALPSCCKNNEIADVRNSPPSADKHNAFGRIMVRIDSAPEDLSVGFFSCYMATAGRPTAIVTENNEWQCPITESDPNKDTRKDAATDQEKKFWDGRWYINDFAILLGGRGSTEYDVVYSCQTEKHVNSDQNGWWPEASNGARCIGKSPKDANNKLLPIKAFKITIRRSSLIEKLFVFSGAG